MKKYGKYEKRPEGIPEKAPKAKSMLLQTYFSSLLCLVLCVTMFLGTTYAWFSTEMTNTGNEIYIGTLDVGLYDGEDKDLAQEGPLFDSTIRWEPGYTALETIKVVNEGDLACSYTLTFTDGLLNDQETSDLADVTKWFEVWVYEVGDSGFVKPQNYNALAAEDSGWAYVDTLDQVLEGKNVLHGSIAAGEDITAEEAAPSNTYVIALHMRESADIAVMGQKISLSVKLVAYQMSSEEDAFGNTYDQVVSSSDELTAALQNGGTVVLVNDIAVEDSLTVPKDVVVALELNGYKISMEIDTPTSLIKNNGTLIVNDSIGEGAISITFDGITDNGTAVNAVDNRGTMVINGGTISNTGNANDQIGYAVDNYNGASLTVNGGTITASGSSYYDGIRLFCGNNETVVTINGGAVSSIWAQNPSDNKDSEVKGTVILNGGEVTTTYYENYTTVKVASDVTATVTAYGAGKDNTTTEEADGYTVYSFVH